MTISGNAWDKLTTHMQDAAQRGWEALAHRNFAEFARYAAAWQALENVARTGEPHPFTPVVRSARTGILGKTFVEAWICRACGTQLDSRTCRACGTTRGPKNPANAHASDCTYCNSKNSVVEGTVSLARADGPTRYVVTNIPARVCQHCTDYSVDALVLHKLQQVAAGEAEPHGELTLSHYDMAQL